MHRYIIAGCLILSAFVLPWWVTLLIALYGAFRFSWFFEALIAGLIIDSMYETHAIWGISGFATLLACLIVLSMTFIRRHIRHDSFSS
jgi:hypothetical protein